MNPDLGRHLSIRANAYVAGEPVPFFWPMRSFIHHNPLHGLEHLPFPDAVAEGSRLFHADGFLPRSVYQGYLADGQMDADALAAGIDAAAAEHPQPPGVNLARWAHALLETMPEPVCGDILFAEAVDVHAVLNGGKPTGEGRDPLGEVRQRLRRDLLGDRPIYDAVDSLFGSALGAEIDELVVRACLDFFDEGQSVWMMPGRGQGFFAAWTGIAGQGAEAVLDQVRASASLDAEAPLMAEAVIDHVMTALQIPEENWTRYFTQELVHLHGWTGFIRWRANAQHYHWADRFPGDLVDLLAVRLTIGWALLNRLDHAAQPRTVEDLERLIDERPEEAFLRMQLHSGGVLPSMVGRVDAALDRGNPTAIKKVFADYVAAKRVAEAEHTARALRRVAEQAGESAALDALSVEGLADLVAGLRAVEAGEGMIWLEALEAKAMTHLLEGVDLTPEPSREKRPFVQAAFCIDTRSERIRRHLESVGDYQTFGIAGFFGVPVSLIELGKGSEMHLCPVLLTPKNLVLEMSSAVRTDEAAVTTLERALHNLKESVVSPFVTVEAIGLLFGFDMIGKTVAPQLYNTWRNKHLHEHKPNTHLLLDKLNREQADSILRAVQRAVIVEAVVSDLDREAEAVTDDLVRDLREAALGNAHPTAELAAEIDLDQAALGEFLDRLRRVYRINASFAHLQLEQLGRIGFSLEEQASFVLQALSSIGLTEDFSRFVLLIGHGSQSENNPYESALDCGACGGNHGLFSARVLAQMANKPQVRRRLAQKGVEIPDDAWFIPAWHNTTTDEISLHDLELLPTSHLVYLDRLRTGLSSATRLCAQERLPSLNGTDGQPDLAKALSGTRRNSMDWSQVRPEWGLARNAYFVIGRRSLTQALELDGRAFLHSYDYRVDPGRRLLENILTGPLVVGQWINMEHYFSTVDNERFGSGSKVYHNVAGRFGVMTGNLGDLRTGLPAQTVLDKGQPYHQPVRLMTVIEAPFESARTAIESVSSVKRLVRNRWIRVVVIDPETGFAHEYQDGEWTLRSQAPVKPEEAIAS